MKAKRLLSLLLTLMMVLSCLSGFAVSAGATEASQTPAAPPDGTIFVNLGWTESDTPASITVNGKTFALTWGTNAFATAQNGLDAAPAGGTVYLCAGTYGGFNYTKNLTVLGAKYGIDPNVRYADELKPWTLNTDRGGSDETVITGNVHFGISGNTMYHDATDMTLDGVKVTGKGQLRAHNAKKNNNGMVKVAVKNIYLKDSTVTNGSPLCFRPFYGLDSTTGVTSNACQRDITIENLRIEGQTKVAMELIADKTDISGVYMHTDCTGTFLSGPAASANSTDEVTFRLADSMFCNPVYRTIYLNWQTGSASYSSVSVNANIGNRSKVSTTVENCVFLKSHNATQNFTLAFAVDTENAYFTFKNNTFYTSGTTSSGYAPLAGHSEVATKKYGSRITITGNKFIGSHPKAYNFSRAGEYVDFNGNYNEDADGNVSMPVVDRFAAQEWWYLDRAMTQRSDEAGIIAPLPDDTIFVDQSWTETTTPASITVNGKSFNLTWGTNAFATAQGGLDKAANCGTVYLCPGTYGGGLYVKKNVRILGAKYGIDPNVKYENELKAWTLNPARGGTDETVWNGTMHLGVNGASVYNDATHMIVDGLKVTGAGQFRSNCGTANTNGMVKVALKNIYLKDSTATVQPLYFQPYYGLSKETGASSNAYQRDITVANLRIEGQKTSAVMALTADKADISGVYMHTDCTKIFLTAPSASANSTDEVTLNIHDSMFCPPIYRVIYLNWQTGAASVQGVSLNANIANRSKVSTTVENCVFLDSHDATNAFTLALAQNTTNTYYTFKNNTFYTSTACAATYAPLAGHSEDTTKKYGSKIIVKNNKFIGSNPICWSYSAAGENVDVNGNYHEKSDGTVSHITTSGPVLQDWWWMDRAMTIRSDGGDVPTDRLADIETDVKWLGRTYVADERHYFNWTNSGFEFNIDGTGATALMSSSNPSTNKSYLKIYVDGVETKTVQMTAPVMNVTLAEGLSDGPHTIKVIKRTNGRSGTAALMKLWVDEGTEVLAPNKEAGRKIQFLGDSITVGYGSMDWLSPSAWSTDSEDGTITYAALTSKYFGADNHTIAVSGRGVIWNTGGNKDTANHAPLMYEYTDWNNHDQWDHSNYQPDVVVINLGTNDSGSCSTAEDHEIFGEAAYNLIAQVRKANPDAEIIWAYGAMGDSRNLRADVEAAVAKHNAAGDSKVSYLHFGTGTTCLGHPTSAAHEDRAEELIAKITEITGWDEHTECDYDVQATTAATCVKDGYGEFTCKVCGDYYEGVIPATGEHSFTIEQSKTPATCVAEGSVTNKCSTCDATETKTLAIDPTAHTGKNTIEGAVAGDCGNAGHTGKTVCECGVTINEGETIPATGEHGELEYVVKTPATTEAEGLAYNKCTVCGKQVGEDIILPKTGVAVIGDKSYATLEEALSAAKANDTVKLNADVTVDYITIDPAVTLDLNGKTLTADYVIGFNGSIIGGEGKLIVKKDKVALDQINGGYLPVYDGEGYKFIKVTMQEMKETDAETGETYYYFSPDLSAAHEELLKGAASSGVKIVVRLSWSKAGNYTATQDFIYMDGLVKTVIDSYGKIVEYPNHYADVFKATFEGTEAGEAADLKISAVLVSATGVELGSTGISFAG